MESLIGSGNGFGRFIKTYWEFCLSSEQGNSFCKGIEPSQNDSGISFL